MSRLRSCTKRKVVTLCVILLTEAPRRTDSGMNGALNGGQTLLK
jgi:hypothetical protein